MVEEVTGREGSEMGWDFSTGVLSFYSFIVQAEGLVQVIVDGMAAAG